MAVAAENTTSNDNMQVATPDTHSNPVQNFDDSIESADDDSNMPQTDSNTISDSDNEVDLIIFGGMKSFKNQDTYRDNIELIIYAYNINGISHNTKANININHGLKFLNYDANKGTYNSKTGIWNIGDLGSSEPAILKIQFEVNEYKEYTAKLKITADSVETDPSNNYYTDSIIIKEPEKHNVTTGNNDLDHNKHRSHYRSSASGLVSRSVTKSVNISEPEAASVEKPTANPIIALLISIALIGITRRD